MSIFDTFSQTIESHNRHYYQLDSRHVSRLCWSSLSLGMIIGRLIRWSLNIIGICYAYSFKHGRLLFLLFFFKRAFLYDLIDWTKMKILGIMLCSNRLNSIIFFGLNQIIQKMSLHIYSVEDLVILFLN